MLHYVTKAPVERDAEYAGTKASFQATRDMEFVGKEDGPRIGGPPQDGLIVVVPGKNAVPIGFKQSFGSQVAADGEQTIR